MPLATTYSRASLGIDAPQVRVEVHLSNGIELGPTKSVDLKPAQKSKINLPAKNQKFETWSTHAESGSYEGGHGKERGEHKSEKGEHKGERGEHGKENNEHNKKGEG